MEVLTFLDHIAGGPLPGITFETLQTFYGIVLTSGDAIDRIGLNG